MTRSSVMILFLFCSLTLFGDPWQERKREALARRPAPRAAVNAGKPVTVDCAKKDSIQQAIDQNPNGTVIEVHGLCIENVRINHKEVTLRGASPATDGIRTLTSTPALTIVHSDSTTVENLSFNDSPATAVQIGGESQVFLNDCVVSNNNTTDAFVQATNLTVSGNRQPAMRAQRGAFFFCLACDFSGNLGFAAVATRGGLLSLLDSTVTGRFGIQATGYGAYADLDCLSESSAHPCSMQATGRAARAFEGGTAALYGAGDFTGQVSAFDRATVWLYGARQLAAGQPGEGPAQNHVDYHAMLNAGYAFETDQSSRLLSTNAATFGRVLVTENTEVNGTIQCQSKAQAWLDPEVVLAPGSSVTGCS